MTKRSMHCLCGFVTLLVTLLVSCGPVEPTRSGAGEYAQVAFVVDGDTVELVDGRRVRYTVINKLHLKHPNTFPQKKRSRSRIPAILCMDKRFPWSESTKHNLKTSGTHSN